MDMWRFFKSSEKIFSLSLSEIPPLNWNIAPIELSSVSFFDGFSFLSLSATYEQALDRMEQKRSLLLSSRDFVLPLPYAPIGSVVVLAGAISVAQLLHLLRNFVVGHGALA